MHVALKHFKLTIPLAASAALLSLWTPLPSAKRSTASATPFCQPGLYALAKTIGHSARKLGKATVHTAQLSAKGIDYVLNAPKRRAQKEQDLAAAYKAAATRKISDYFRNMYRPTPEEIEVFRTDFRLVYESFEKIHLPDRGTIKAKEIFIEKWEAVAEELLREPSFIGTNGNKTLQAYFMERHFDAARSESAKQAEKVQNLSYYLKRGLWSPVYLTQFVISKIFGESKWTVRLIFASILGAAFSNIHEPITANLTTWVNQNLGWLGMGLQMVITRFSADFEHAQELQEDMEETEEQMKNVQQKYRIKKMSKNDAIKLWEKLDETFLNYAKEMRSVIPDNIASGRAYYKDGNFTNPIAFITSAASINSERMLHENVVRNLSLKQTLTTLTKEPLSAAEQVELEFHKKQAEVSKKRLGTVLAMWRVYEIIYPEMTRASFMKAGLDNNALKSSYQIYREGLDFDAYAEEYVEQMHTALTALGLEIERAKSLDVAYKSKPHLNVDLSILPKDASAAPLPPIASDETNALE